VDLPPHHGRARYTTTRSPDNSPGKRKNTLIGTITNTLPTAVSDTFILFEQHAMPLERLEAGQTRQVLLDIPTT
jgi:hypothetical protein